MSDPGTEPPGPRAPLSGREPLLAQLVAAWQNVARGQPQLVVIRGETGLGKTRLVQGFYEWLTVDGDPGGYWPANLGQDGESLRVSPRFEEKESRGEIPWMWLALRFADPGGRNDVPGVQLSYVLDQLKPHLRPLLQFEARKQLVKSVALEAAGNLANMLSMNIPGAVLSVINLVEAVRAERSVAAAGKRGVASEVLAQRQELAQQLRDFFAAVLNPKSPGMRHVPIVLFLDDAHWADSYTLALVESLLTDAVAGRWPLLLVCTHWEREWHEQLAAAQRLGATEAPQSLPHLVVRNRGLLGAWEALDVPALEAPAVALLASRSLPGLTQAQLAAIGDWVGGNPQLLQDLVALLRSNTRWFTDRDPSQALTPDGERRLRSLLLQTSHHALIQSRFNVLPETLREVLALATVHGTRFVAGLIVEAARRMEGFEPQEVFTLIETAHRPLAILEPASDSLREFRHRTMFEVARQRLETIYDVEQRAQLDGHLRDILAGWLASEPWGQLDAYAEEQLLMLAVALGDAPEALGQPRWPIARLRATLRLIAHCDRRALHAAARDYALNAAQLTHELAAGGAVVDAALAFATDLLAPAVVLARAGRVPAAMAHLRTLDRHTDQLFQAGTVRGLLQVQIAAMASVLAPQLQQPAEALAYADRALVALTALEGLAADNGATTTDLQENFARERAVLANTRAGILGALGQAADAWRGYSDLIGALELQRERAVAAGQWTAMDAQILGMAYVSRAMLSVGRETALVALADLEAAGGRLAASAAPTDDEALGLGATLATRAVMHRWRGAPVAAQQDFTQAIAVLEGLAERHRPLHEWNPAAQLLLTFACLHGGILQREQSAAAVALTCFQRARDLIAELRGALEPAGAWTELYAGLERELYPCLARAQFDLDDLQGALATYTHAAALLAQQAERDSHAARLERAAVASGLTVVHAALGHEAEALVAADDTVALRLAVADRLEAGSAAEMSNRHNLAIAYLDRASCQPAIPEGRQRARQDVDRAIELLQALWESGTAEPLLRHTTGISLAAACESLGWQHRAADDAAAARRAYDAGNEVLESLSRGIAADDPRQPLLQRRLGNLRERLAALATAAR